jgi:hypothetical protein
MSENALELACHGVLKAHKGRDSSAREAIISLGLMMMNREEAVVCFERALESWSEAALPIHGTILRLLYHAQVHQGASDLAVRLGKLVPRVERIHQAHFAGGSHLSRSGAADERLVPMPPDVETPLLEVGRNAILIQSESDLADVAVHIGHETQEIMLRRTRRAQALARKLWWPEAGCFCARHRGRWIQPLTADGLLALYCGAATPMQAREIAARYLQPPGGFWSPHPLALGPHGSPLHVVSPLLNWLMIIGTYRYGLDDLAEELQTKTLALAERSGMWALYHPESGEGIVGENDVVTAAMILYLLRAPYKEQKISLF